MFTLEMHAWMKGDKYVIPDDNLNNTAPSIGTFAGRGLERS
jgi:hypothetical protein